MPSRTHGHLSLSEFFAHHPSFDLKNANFWDEQVQAQIDWKTFGQGVKKEEGLDRLRAWQRLYRVSNKLKTVENLYSKGLHSSYQIAAFSKARFIEQYEECFAEKAEAEQVYQNALSSYQQTQMTYFALAQSTAPHYRAARFNNLSHLADQAYAQVPSYQDLFGFLDFCTCPDCRSIFSPAAYFVDLMRLEANYIDIQNEAQALTKRRPDLLTIVLSCENTNQLIPKIDLVNTVLQQTYGGQEERWMQEKYPFDLPFDWPLFQIQTFLEAQSKDLASCWKNLAGDSVSLNLEKLALATLKISEAQWRVIGTDHSKDKADVCQYYGLPGDTDNPEKVLENVIIFLEKTGLNKPQLDELFDGDLSDHEPRRKDLQKDFFINVGSSAVLDLKEDKIEGLDLPRLDHIHRFIRLSQQLAWSFPDVDWALSVINDLISEKENHKEIELNEKCLPYLSWMKELENKNPLKFSVNWACALLGELKIFGEANGPSFFDGIFNAPNIPPHESWFNRYDPSQGYAVWNVPSANENSETSEKDQRIQSALAAALSLSVSDLLSASQLLIDMTQAGDQVLTLNFENLAILYRLSQLPSLTGWSLQEVLVACDLLPQIEGVSLKEILIKNVKTLLLAAFNSLMTLCQYAREVQLPIYRLEYWLTGDSHDLSIKNSILHEDAITNFLNATEKNLIPTLFTRVVLSQSLSSSLEGLSALEIIWEYLITSFIDFLGQGIIIANTQSDEAKDEIYQNLREKLKGLSDDKIKNLADLLQASLANYQDLQQYTIVHQLAGLYSLDAGMIMPLMRWVGNRKSTHLTAVLSEDMLKDMQRLANLVKILQLSPAELENIQQEGTASCYGIEYNEQALSWLNLSVIQNILKFKNLIVFLKDTQNRLISYLNWSVALPADNQTAAAQLALLVGEEYQEDLAFLMEMIWPIPSESLNSVPKFSKINHLALLLQYFDLAKTTHLNINLLWNILQLNQGDQSYHFWENMANALWAGLQKLYQNDFRKLQQIQGKLSGQKRDILASLVIFKLNQTLPNPITNLRGLYEHCLIDVEVSSEVKTSLVLEGISTVQLYIYRCLNHLESSASVKPGLDDLWSWMSSYRLWEANREIFVFPENYLEPQLRHQKTPLFLSFENSLNQVDMNDTSKIEDIFRGYLIGLEEVSDLAILSVAVYDDILKDNNVIVSSNQLKMKTVFIVAQTEREPYRYYHRKIQVLQNKEMPDQFLPVEWDAWHAIELPLKPKGPINAVFAFGRWFIFWVEFCQSNSEVINGQASPIYTASICYSYLDANQRWMTPQIMQGSLSLPSSSTLNSNIGYWDRVFPQYFHSNQQLVLPYGFSDKRELYYFNRSPSFQGVLLSRSYCGPIRPPMTIPQGLEASVVKQDVNYQYYGVFSEIPANYNVMTISAWIYADHLPGVGGFFPIALGDAAGSKAGVVLDSEGYFNFSIGNNTIIQKETSIQVQAKQWYHFASTVRPEKELTAAYPYNSYKPNLFWHQNQLYMIWAGLQENTIIMAALDNANPQNVKYQYVSEFRANGNAGISVAEYQGAVYFSYSDASNDQIVLGHVEFHMGGTFTLVRDGFLTEPSGQEMFGYSNLCAHKTALYLSWINKNPMNTQTTVGRLDLNTKRLVTIFPLIEMTQFLVIDGSLLGDLVSYKNKVASEYLYVSWHDPSGKSRIAEVILDDALNPTRLEYLFLSNSASDSIYNPFFWTYNDKLYMFVSRKGIAPVCFQVKVDESGRPINVEQTNSFDRVRIASPSNNPIVINPQEGKLYFCWSDSNHLINLCAYESSQQKAYINGELKLQADLTKLEKLSYFGWDGQSQFNGIMQEMLGYNRALETEEIKTLYLKGLHHMTSGMTAQVSMSSAFGVYQENTIQNKDLFVPTQNNWHFLQTTFGEKILAIPYAVSGVLNSLKGLDCYRLNTTAATSLVSQLLLEGVSGLLNINTQKTPELDFNLLKPNLDIVRHEPSQNIDFFESPYSIYYWELFFYAPNLIANMCNTHQKFEQAKVWYEYIFNPSAADQPSKISNDIYWNFIGLQAENNAILARELSLPWAKDMENEFRSPLQVYRYHMDPFDPHAIAQLRPIAYQKNIVMTYIDNLIQWGDALFRQYTSESVVAATMLYTMAYDLLGRKPINLGECALPEALSLSAILATQKSSALKDLPEFLILLENRTPHNLSLLNQVTPANFIEHAYFGLPENEQFMSYWDTITQRLYNIRHALSIEGVAQQLQAFQPALNALKVIRALSQGQGIAQIINGLKAEVPYYRFKVIIEKSKEIAQMVIQFGQSLLGALEKRDAEQLALMANLQQQQLLALTQQSLQERVNAVQASLNALQFSLKNATDRLNYYVKMLAHPLSSSEAAQIELDNVAVRFQVAAQVVKAGAVAGYLLPNIFGLADGGMNFGGAIQSVANVMEGSAFASNMAAGLSGTIASYQRRSQEWELQKNLAQDDIQQIQAQMISVQSDLKVAEQETILLATQMQQQQSTDEFLKNKFTNEELYQWLIGKLSTLYFQAYQLAYNLAVMAEQSWQFERGEDTVFIQGAYWDNLYQGLSAGEGLLLDLHRMEASYLKQNRRYLEIEKTISLAQMNSQTLNDLKMTGECEFSFTQELFDLDYPGHYRRQIKSVSITFPVLLGPYQNIHATLTQTGNTIFLEPGQPPLFEGAVRVDMRANQQIALSQGINDSGLFVLNFEDERYLPFEGTGVISNWHLQMPKASNPFDFNTLTDVIITLRYTAVAGDEVFKKQVQKQLSTYSGYAILAFSQKYANSWQGFMGLHQKLDFEISPHLLRRNLERYQINRLSWKLLLNSKATHKESTTMPSLQLSIPGLDHPLTIAFQDDGQAVIVLEQPLVLADHPEVWTLSILEDSGNLLNMQNCENLLLELAYDAQLHWSGA